MIRVKISTDILFLCRLQSIHTTQLLLFLLFILISVDVKKENNYLYNACTIGINVSKCEIPTSLHLNPFQINLFV